MTPTEAYRAVTEPCPSELHEIGSALARDITAAPFDGGATVELVSNLLQMSDVQTWPESGRVPDPDPNLLFKPFASVVRSGGFLFQTFVPEHLQQADESPVRALASTTANPRVAAHLREALWVRYKKFEDASAAIEARLRCVSTLDPTADWVSCVQNIGRLASFLNRFNRMNEFLTFLPLLDDCCIALRTGPRPIAFTMT